MKTNNPADESLPTLAASAPTASAGGGTIPDAIATRESGIERQSVVARGGMGEVWQGLQRSLGRFVAVKTVRSDKLRSIDSLGRSELEQSVRREAFVGAQLEHPAIVPVYEFLESGDLGPQLVMRLVRGRNWGEDLRTGFTEMDVSDYLARHLPILQTVAQAVAYAHSRGVVHRDLKPSQVMIGEFGEVQLLDWGMAVRVGQEVAHPSLQLLTPAEETQPFEGTPAYMAPEQLGAVPYPVGTYTDVFQLGAILYQILTGVPPHQGATAAAAIHRAKEVPIVPPVERVEGRRHVPEALAELAMRCLEPNPMLRLQSARGVVDGIADFVAGAGRRRRAAGLMREADALLEQPPTYGSLMRASVLLEEAAGLWPENKATHDGLQRVGGLLVEAALQAGDLRLAEAALPRVANPHAREDFARRLEAENRLRRRRESQRRWAMVGAAVLALCLVVTTGAWMQHRQRVAEALALAERRERLQLAGRALETRLNHHVELLHAMASLFSTADEVPLGMFRDFVAPIVERHPGIQALEWVPEVPHADRATFEATLAELHPGVPSIRERDSEGKPIEAPVRDVYFPVKYVQPVAGNEAAIGLNLGFTADRLAGLVRARDRGVESATARIRLAQEQGEQFGILVAVPSYRSGTNLRSVDDRRAAFLGFALGVYRLDDLLQSAFEGRVDSRASFELFDVTDGTRVRLAGYRGTATQTDGPPPTESTELRFGGRVWELVMTEPRV